MSIVTLVSGGLDSTLMALLVKEENIEQFPLFISYGQICREQELKACIIVHKNLGLPAPVDMNISGFGAEISSGLTDPSKRVNEDAFLPGRNLLFLLAGSAYAYQTNSSTVAIALLSEKNCIFPDQTNNFINKAQETISLALGRDIKIIAPLMQFSKNEILHLAGNKGISDTYSCHSGTETPCGKCISCIERNKAIKGGK
ncbi:7-cyano-7-deazaguanine synthase [Chloroflexota bacterium]